MKNKELKALPKLGLAAALMLANTMTFATTSTTLGTRNSTSQSNPAITTNSGATWKNYSRAAQYPGAVTLPLQFITLSTGQKLAVLVSVPADASGKPITGSFPVILTQTAYRIDLGQLIGGVLPTDTTLLIGGLDKYMVTRGYVTVAVDVLGSGMSDGEAQLLGSAEQAAYGEAVNWITKQSFFDGNLGLAGTSYLGIDSLLTAEQRNPAVKAVFAEVPMGDPYRATVAPGGMVNAEFTSLWLSLTQTLSTANGPAELANPTYAAQIKAATAQHIASVDDWYLPTLNNVLAGNTGYATDDGDFWAVRSSLERAAQIQVPTFIVGGSNDIFQRDEPLLYEQLKRNVNTKLLIVPGSHVGSILNAINNSNNIISNGAPDSESLLLQWFDQYLKGINTGAATLPNVTQYVQGYGLLGTTRYASTTDWPHPLVTAQRMYMHGNGSLNTTTPVAGEATHTLAEPKAPVVSASKSSSGTLQTKVTLNDGSDCSNSYVQWTLGIAGLLPLPCYSNDAIVENAQHAITFQTPTLTSNLYLNGPMEADVWLSSTGSQAAVAVRVDDVDALGIATPITTGLMSANYRAVDTSRSRYMNGMMIQPWHPFTAASAQPLVAGQPVMVPVEIFPAAALIRAGHKLRVSISASNQTEGIWTLPMQSKANGNTTTIYNDVSHPTSVVLPVVPASTLN
ncbi:MAG: CocE/NonD family hydrolase [Gammaproteobacteria bacterium]|nr:CocE/NonD family hydrolase [Gammaproteobacteria bacterium]